MLSPADDLDNQRLEKGAQKLKISALFHQPRVSRRVLREPWLPSSLLSRWPALDGNEQVRVACHNKKSWGWMVKDASKLRDLKSCFCVNLGRGMEVFVLQTCGRGTWNVGHTGLFVSSREGIQNLFLAQKAGVGVHSSLVTFAPSVWLRSFLYQTFLQTIIINLFFFSIYRTSLMEGIMCTFQRVSVQSQKVCIQLTLSPKETQVCFTVHTGSS